MVAIDQVCRPRRVVGRGNDRLEGVLHQQEVDAFRGAEQLVGGERVVVRDPERLVGGRVGHVELLGELEDFLAEERQLLGGAGAVERDGVGQGTAREGHANARRQVILQVSLEFEQQHRELGRPRRDV